MLKIESYCINLLQQYLCARNCHIWVAVCASRSTHCFCFAIFKFKIYIYFNLIFTRLTLPEIPRKEGMEKLLKGEGILTRRDSVGKEGCHSVHPPPPISAGGLNLQLNFQKLFKKFPKTFFRGGGGCTFHIKNKLKSEIFNYKNIL